MIQRYLEAYNAFDVEGMMELLHPDVLFCHLFRNQITVTTRGKEEFRSVGGIRSHPFQEPKTGNSLSSGNPFGNGGFHFLRGGTYHGSSQRHEGGGTLDA